MLKEFCVGGSKGKSVVTLLSIKYRLGVNSALEIGQQLYGTSNVNFAWDIPLPC